MQSMVNFVRLGVFATFTDQLISIVVQGSTLEAQVLLDSSACAKGDRGAVVNTKNTSNYTTLTYAAESDKRDVVDLLLDQEADIFDRNRLEETVLMSIARFVQTDIVQQLVGMGSEINAVNKIGDTTLYLVMDKTRLPSTWLPIILGMAY
jgi:ankyrin repeat protein